MLRVGDEFFPDAAILIKRLHVNAAEFRRLRRIGKLAQAGATDDAFVNFVNEIIFGV